MAFVFCRPKSLYMLQQKRSLPIFNLYYRYISDQKNVHRMPGRSRDCSFVRSTSSETDALHRNFSDVILFYILQLIFYFKQLYGLRWSEIKN